MSTEYEKLAAPFDKTHKKPVTNLTYITGEQVVTRLNEVLGWDGWSFRVLEHGFHEEADELWALGELTAYKEGSMVVRQQFGSQQHNRAKSDKHILDLGFDLKGAATDALKKCASLIGVGLYLSEKEGGQVPQPPAQAAQKPATPPAAKLPKPSLLEYALSLGHTAEAVHQARADLFGDTSFDDLDATQKRRLIVELEGKKEPVNGRS